MNGWQLKEYSMENESNIIHNQCTLEELAVFLQNNAADYSAWLRRSGFDLESNERIYREDILVDQERLKGQWFPSYVEFALLMHLVKNAAGDKEKEDESVCFEQVLLDFWGGTPRMLWNCVEMDIEKQSFRISDNVDKASIQISEDGKCISFKARKVVP